MGMGRGQTDIRRRDGFTLIETLAALTIASVIIIATAELIHSVALNFDRGTRSASEGERLMLAVERLAQDFGSARFVGRSTESGTALAFTGEQASGDKPASIMFVGSGGVMSGPQGEEVVILTIEQAGDVTRLVRRRAPWMGSRTRFENVSPQDAVVLIEGTIGIAFVFGRIGADGALAWSNSWTGESALPRFVRLILRDRATGSDLLGEADFVVRANAPPACGRPDASASCLSLGVLGATRPSGPERTTP